MRVKRGCSSGRRLARPSRVLIAQRHHDHRGPGRPSPARPPRSQLPSPLESAEGVPCRSPARSAALLRNQEVDAPDVPRAFRSRRQVPPLARYVAHTHRPCSRACLLYWRGRFLSLRSLPAALLQVSAEAGRDYSKATLQLSSDDGEDDPARHHVHPDQHDLSPADPHSPPRSSEQVSVIPECRNF